MHKKGSFVCTRYDMPRFGVIEKKEDVDTVTDGKPRRVFTKPKDVLYYLQHESKKKADAAYGDCLKAWGGLL